MIDIGNIDTKNRGLYHYLYRDIEPFDRKQKENREEVWCGCAGLQFLFERLRSWIPMKQWCWNPNLFTGQVTVSNQFSSIKMESNWLVCLLFLLFSFFLFIWTSNEMILPSLLSLSFPLELVTKIPSLILHFLFYSSSLEKNRWDHCPFSFFVFMLNWLLRWDLEWTLISPLSLEHVITHFFIHAKCQLTTIFYSDCWLRMVLYFCLYLEQLRLKVMVFVKYNLNWKWNK